MTTNTRERANRTIDPRPERVPVSGNRDILTVHGKEKGYEYRWVIDVGDRVNRFKRGGWEIANHDGISVGTSRVQGGDGSVITAHATKGTGDKLVLMRIREEYYKEDQMAKENNLLALEASMGKEVDGGYGKIQIERSSRD